MRSSVILWTADGQVAWYRSSLDPRGVQAHRCDPTQPIEGGHRGRTQLVGGGLMFIVCGTLRHLAPDPERVHPIGGVVVIKHVYKDSGGRPMVEVSGLVEGGTGVLLMTWEVDADRIV